MKNETVNALVCLFLIGMVLAGGGKAMEGAKTEAARDGAVERSVPWPPGGHGGPAVELDTEDESKKSI